MESLPNTSSLADSPGAPPQPAGVDRASGAVAETAWRNELSARLSRYRTRRKAPPPRYPSLNLPFEPVEISQRPFSSEPVDASPIEVISNRTFASDALPHDYSAESTAKQFDSLCNAEAQKVSETSARPSAKIIEFPSFAWGPPDPPRDQLAEPVMDRPRILEVPEVALTPPALGGITIDPAHEESPEKRLGIDIPLQSAPLGRRLAASLVDGLIISAATALFGYIFWKVTAVRPPRIQLFSLAAGIPCVFWAAYQYLLIVYSASTPGLRLLRLQLTRFDGTFASRSLRRWRVLAAWLSAASLGMGYVWALLDEDVLCWHDRITHTYLAPTRKP